jgi:hypothetical protein
MNTSKRQIRARRKAKAMRLQRWNKVPYHFSKTHCLYGMDARVMPTKAQARNTKAQVPNELAAAA